MDVTNESIGQLAEGKTFDFLPESAIKTEELKTFEFDSEGQLITTETEEFTAVCPFSGLPDIAKLTIKYNPVSGKCIELKSLKYYLLSFRNVGIYQEAVTKRIAADLFHTLDLKCNFNLYVKTIYNVRGGFLTTCEEGYKDI
jgi:7-cyano-7-deazaguanine reductase